MKKCINIDFLYVKHYIDLNEEFVMKNTKGSSSTDYFSRVTSATYMNCLPVSDSNMSSCYSENKNDIALKPMCHDLEE